MIRHPAAAYSVRHDHEAWPTSPDTIGMMIRIGVKPECEAELPGDFELPGVGDLAYAPIPEWAGGPARRRRLEELVEPEDPPELGALMSYGTGPWDWFHEPWDYDGDDEEDEEE